MLAREQARAAMTDAWGTPDGRDGHCGGHDAAPARLSVTPPQDALRVPTKAAPAALPPCRPAALRGSGRVTRCACRGATGAASCS